MKKALRCGALLCAVLLMAGNCLAADYYKISLAGTKLEKNERIAGFEITVNAGRIYSVTKAPAGWDLAIDNDPSWMTSIRGTGIVASAFLGSNDKDLLENLLTIEKAPEEISKEIPFDVNATIQIVNSETEEERTVKQIRENLVIKIK